MVPPIVLTHNARVTGGALILVFRMPLSAVTGATFEIAVTVPIGGLRYLCLCRCFGLERYSGSCETGFCAR